MNRRASSASSITALVVGSAMIALGLYIALRLLASNDAPLTGRTWLDATFAGFFVIRGALQWRRWRARGGQGPGPG